MRVYTNLEQIEILKEAKRNLKRYKYGLCGAIRHASGEIMCDGGWNDKAITLFTMEGCLTACRKNRVKLPNFSMGYWWEPGDNKSRFAFISWAIKELKK